MKDIQAIDPAHYAKLSPEPIAVIEQWGLDFKLGGALKYIARHGRKGGEADARADLLKAANLLYRAATGRWLPRSVLEDEATSITSPNVED
jgi:Protein of unknwon function (DUF3310)